MYERNFFDQFQHPNVRSRDPQRISMLPLCATRAGPIVSVSTAGTTHSGKRFRRRALPETPTTKQSVRFVLLSVRYPPQCSRGPLSPGLCLDSWHFSHNNLHNNINVTTLCPLLQRRHEAVSPTGGRRIPSSRVLAHSRSHL